MQNPFEQPSIPLDQSGEALPGNAHQQDLEAMERVPSIPCPYHEGEMTFTQLAIGGEVIHSCRTTGKRVYDQDAVA